MQHHGSPPAPYALSFGEVLWDMLPSGPMLGGAPANFAFRLQSLGIPVVFVSRVGGDKAGTEALSCLATAGLDTRWIQTDPLLPTGTVNVVIDPVGNASYVINKQVAYDAITLTDELLAAAKGCSVLCFGTLSQREEASRRTLYSLLDAASSATKILDINLRRGCYTEKTVRESLEATHILKLNGDEAVELSKMLWGRALPFREFASNAVSRYHLRSCLVTLAADGIYGLGADGTETVLPGHSVQVVDTIGSGDAFTAGFAYQLLQGSPLPECCDYGNRLGALTATTTGAMTPISPAQIASFPPDGRRVAVGS